MSTLSYEDIKLLIKNRFKLYDLDILYNFRVNLIDNKTVIENIMFYSTPEEIKFSNKHWKKYTKDANTYVKFRKAKEKYVEEMKKEFKSCKCARVSMTLDEYLNHPNLQEYKDMNKYLKLNIKSGSKRQYASYIPHIQITTKNEITWESVDVYNIKEDYKIVRITEDNMDEYKDDYIKLYKESFNVKYSDDDFKKDFDKSLLFIYKSADNFAIFRYKHMKNNSVCKYFKYDEMLYLSTLAVKVKNKGVGKLIVKYMITLATKKELPLTLTPGDNVLIKYYEKIGFETYEPNSKDLPRYIQIVR